MKSYFKIIRCMFEAGKKIILGAFCIFAISLAIEIAIPIGINEMISKIETEREISHFLIGIIIFALAYTISCFLLALNTKLYIRIGNHLLWNMREKIYNVLWKTDYFDSVQKEKDKFKFVLTNQTYTAFAIAVIYSLGGIANALTVVSFIIVTFLYSIPVGVTLIISIALTLVVSFFTGKGVLNSFEECTKAEEKDTSQIYETVDLVEATRTNGLEQYFLKKNHIIHNEYMKLSEKAESKSTFCEAIENALHAMIYICIAGILLLTEKVDGGEIVTILFIANMTLDISQRVQRQLQVIIKNIPVFNNVIELMELPVYGGEEISPIDTIEIDNASFCIDDRMIFDNLNVKIKKGENVIIRGENGSGKSSVLKMILGLYRPTGGEIRINGKNVKDYDVSLFYKEICYISQEELILNETVEDYLKFITHCDISKEDLKEAREKVKLSDEIQKIEENGETLSGGEKKKLFMLKCLLKDKCSLVILDEIDAGVDVHTKNKWKEIEENLKQDREKILLKISHIDSETDGFDRIIQL